jgi:DNA-binding transcriptional LysR family regulator
MTDSTDPMRVFVAAVDRGGFTAAADSLEITPSGVSKIIGRLEDRLGVRLLNRTTRRIDLTPEGETYLSSARFILAEIDEMEAAVGQSSTRPKGLLRVNTGTAFAVHALMPVLPVFLAQFPEINLTIDVTDRRVDVVAERADVAIRGGPVGDGALMVRKIADMRRVIVAAPAYLERYGRPGIPSDLAAHSCLLLSDQPSLARWPFLVDGQPVSMDVSGRVAIGSADALMRLAVAGGGIARLSDVVVAEALRTGALVPLLQDSHVVEPGPISAVYPAGRHRAPKVRVFIEFLVEQFRHAPWRVDR